jgi:hypothetical protein
MRNKKLSTNALTVIFCVPILLILWAWSLIRNSLAGSEFQFIIDSGLLLIAFFLTGCCGVVWTIRKEAPQLFMLKGKPAVIMGITFVVFSFSLILLTIYKVIVHF